ncbi:hypothetical protein [Streptomyces sp. NPDC057509]|uniref:WXG100 family type VII secretion target n=1 Tax=Streptomyces sp. NPDC057509 TaxID=3346152 RepID=UPI00368AD66C
MSKFPEGPFTIVNQDTGRCLRVRLGETVDLSDYKEGTKYLLSRTFPPTLELGPNDGSDATAWYYRYHEDRLERQQFSQIASTAVDKHQNIGEYGVWMFSKPAAVELEKVSLREWYASRLNDTTGDIAKRLDALIPQTWTTQAAQDYASEMEKWKAEGEQFEGTIEQLNTRQADLMEEMRAQAAKVMEAVREQAADLTKANNATDQGMRILAGGESLRVPAEDEVVDHTESSMLAGVWHVHRLEEEMERAAPQDQARMLEQQLRILEFTGGDALLRWLKSIGKAEGFEEPLKEMERTEDALAEALKAETPVRAWQRRAPLKGVARWNDRCATLSFYDTAKLDDNDKKHVEEMRTYLAAAAKEGITKPVSRVGARTEMFGCGAMRYGGSTYRWDYDGTYITASDSKTVSSEQTYWTDDEGQLVGKAKGHPGQKWTIAPYKAPTKAPDTGGADLPSVFLTGLFGPIASVFNRA